MLHTKIDLSSVAKLLPRDKIDWTSYFFTLALVASSRSDCTRRQIGTVVVSPDNRVLSTGYNSPPPGIKSTVQEYKEIHGCYPGADFGCCKGVMSPVGSSYDSCRFIHSEASALMFLGQREARNYDHIILYLAGRNGQTGELVTSDPCINCAKLIQSFNVSAINYLAADGSITTVLPKELKITS